MWVYVCTPKEHGAGTSDTQSHQTCGGKRVWLWLCVSQRDRWMPRGGGLDSLIEAKHLLASPHSQCHKLPTQTAKPVLLPADTIPLLFQFIKHQSRKCYFSYKAKPSRVPASQGSTRSATAFLCHMWSRKLSDTPNPLSLFTVFTAFREF